MESPLQPIRSYFKTIFTGLILLAFSSCEEDEKPKTAPVVTTAPVTNITTTTATGGGTIIANGGSQVTAGGLAYSSTNTLPTIEDNTKEESASAGAFTSSLEELASGTTYHVRAYAINAVGIGYGEVVTFTTGNAAPVVTNVTIAGDLEVLSELTVSYTYSDPENDAEGETSVQWYVADDPLGAGATPIDGATASTYTVQEEQQGKYLSVTVTPKALTGTLQGEEVRSSWAGAVGESATEVTFMYNGQKVTYGIITTNTGKKWMDRNLGASQVATSYQDHLAYGDLFQWGRAADGHQLMNYTGPFSVTPVNETTTTYSPTDTPGDARFIIGGLVSDWRTTPNDLLWRAPYYTNNPCPAGWHIPTQAEWDAEIEEGNIEELKLTAPGRRRMDNGGFSGGTGTYSNVGVGGRGFYWSSTPTEIEGNTFHYVIRITSTNTIETPFKPEGSNGRANGFSCRCVKN